MYRVLMDPAVQIAKKGSCPICGMEMVPTKRGEPIEIPDGKLEEFCKHYIDEAMEQIEQHQGPQIYLIVGGYVALHGNASVTTLRSLLSSTNFDCVAQSAAQLRILGDHDSIPTLQ